MGIEFRVFPDCGFADADRATPVERLFVDGEGISGRAQIGESFSQHRFNRLFEKRDLSAGFFAIGKEVSEWCIFDHANDFGLGADDGRHRVTEGGFEFLFYLRFQFRGRARRGREEQVSARDVGAYLLEPHLGKEIAQVIHFDATFAEINSAEKSNVSRHGNY